MMEADSPRPWWQSRWLAAVLALCAAVPLLVPSFPPLIDLPAHFSGYYVQETIARSPALARFFTFQWKFIPNLGVELLIVPLTPLVGLQLAVKLVVAAIPALAVAGMLWIAFEAHGRIPPTALFALPLAFGYPLIFGFVNYCLSVSLALVALGLWLRLSRQGRTGLRSVVFAVVAPAIMVAHALGYGILVITAGGTAVGAAISSKTPPHKAVWSAILACLPMAWPLLLLPLWQGGASPPSGGWFDLARLAIAFTTILREQFQWWDLAGAALLYAVAALPILWRGRFAYAPVLAVPAVLLWLLSILLPFNVFGSDFVNVRLMPVACALTILAVRPRAAAPSWVPVIAIALLALRLGVTAFDMDRADSAIQAELKALDHVLPGSRVATFVVLRCTRRWEPPRMQHIGSWATSRRDSFSNDQFSRSEGQLLGFRSDVGSPIRPMPDAAVMSEPCARWPTKPTLAQALQQISWDHVDYLWLIDVPPAQIPNDARLTPLWRNHHSILFRLRKGIAD
jgi:hypothetical protein